jgi:hypothetical protein
MYTKSDFQKRQHKPPQNSRNWTRTRQQTLSGTKRVKFFQCSFSKIYWMGTEEKLQSMWTLAFSKPLLVQICTARVEAIAVCISHLNGRKILSSFQTIASYIPHFDLNFIVILYHTISFIKCWSFESVWIGQGKCMAHLNPLKSLSYISEQKRLPNRVIIKATDKCVMFTDLQ